MLATTESTFPQTQKLELLEDFMLDLPQVECPVYHHFGPGIYVREVHLPAGIFAVGHAQRFEHLNIMLKGAVAMTADDGTLKVLHAPLLFVGNPGRKFGYVLEDTIWQNIYATEERDIDTLEATYLDKSTTWDLHDQAMRELRTALHQDDRDDYKALLLQLSMTDEEVYAQSVNDADQIQMPEGYAPKFTVRDSYIKGKGVFLSAPVVTGEVIAPARLSGKRTPAGRYTNHAKTPNAEFVLNDTGDIYLVALTEIKGCVAGELGDEVTVNYRQALSLSGIYLEEVSA